MPACRTGPAPQSSAVVRTARNVNAATGRLIDDVREARNVVGSEGHNRPGHPARDDQAQRAAATERISVSTAQCRPMAPAVAPRARRTACSRRLSATRVNMRPDTLAHADQQEDAHSREQRPERSTGGAEDVVEERRHDHGRPEPVGRAALLELIGEPIELVVRQARGDALAKSANDKEDSDILQRVGAPSRG